MPSFVAQTAAWVRFCAAIFLRIALTLPLILLSETLRALAITLFDPPRARRFKTSLSRDESPLSDAASRMR
jgi:hypothetical protein